MIERLVLSIALFALGFALYAFYTRRQTQRLTTDAASDPILADLRSGVPAIVYFTTPHCLPCRTRQQPALLDVVQSMGEENVQIVKIDASENPTAADRWGVFSAPTTFILDAHGMVQAVNHGVADAKRLQRQLLQGNIEEDIDYHETDQSPAFPPGNSTLRSSRHHAGSRPRRTA